MHALHHRHCQHSCQPLLQRKTCRLHHIAGSGKGNNHHSSGPDPQQLEDAHVDMEQFRKLGHEVVDWIADYYKNLQHVPIRSNVQPGYLRSQVAKRAPELAESWEAVMQDFKDKIMPGIVHWQHPRFFGFYSANTSPPAMLADMLAGALNVIGFSWAASPAATELEMVVMDWLAQLCGLPERFLHASGSGGGGTIQGTTSEAVIVAMLAAKARAMQGRLPEDKLKLVAYASDQAHSCFKKACMVIGVEHVRLLPSGGERGAFALAPEMLEWAIQQDLDQGLLPFFVMATVGTTSSCAVDPVEGLASVASRHGAWVHIDAAYAGSAAVCPELREHFAGLDRVESYSFNPHKWLLTNFDCCALWVSDLAPVREALSLTPVFLQGVGNALDLKDTQLPLGRRFRSLKLYFVLRMYGAESLRRYIRHHVALAQHFAGRMAEDPRFEIAAPPRFGLVCFRLRGVGNQVNAALLEAINKDGLVFLTHTELEGRYTIRLAVGSPATQLQHIEQAWDTISAAAGLVLSGSAQTEQNAIV